ncbi:glutamine synthetase [Halobellus sp. Atlit-31R]|nr:glutamine synthetase [Halobellus sp. Atlit-31R]
MSETPDKFETIRLFWVDLNGVARGTSIPATELDATSEAGVSFANSVAELTLGSGLLTDAKYGPEDGDMFAVPDLDSLTKLSWRDGEAAVFSDLKTISGDDFSLCARSALRRVVSDLESAGYVPQVGVEVEFSLLEPDDGGWRPFNAKTSYDADAIDQAAALFDEWYAAMGQAGFDLTGIHQESLSGQYEVSLQYGAARSTMDGVMFFRHLLKSTARSHGHGATVMPRPFDGEDANGMHLHLSLWDPDRKTNRFAAADGTATADARRAGEARLPDDARHFLGGIIEHAQALTAICAPTVNSYKRLVPGIWAPTAIAWGFDNRSTALRVPPESGPGTRIEYRVPDSASNPYLAMAATLAAGFDGIRSEAEPGDPVAVNAHEAGCETLPRTLWSALDYLEADDVLRDALGDDLVTEFVRLKRDEFDRSREAVSDWERDTYLETF